MSNPNPYEQLGVTEDASFDEIQAARSRLLEDSPEDTNQSEAVEMAYDAVLMDRLRLRQEGRIKVPEKIRFPERSPEVAVEAPPKPPVQLPDWLRDTLDSPERNELLWPSVAFFGGAIVSLLLPPTQDATLQLILALGVGGCFYFLNRKTGKFGRSAAVTAIVFIAALAIGSGLASIPAVAGLMASTHIIAVTTFLGLWAASCFVR